MPRIFRPKREPRPRKVKPLIPTANGTWVGRFPALKVSAKQVAWAIQLRKTFVWRLLTYIGGNDSDIDKITEWGISQRNGRGRLRIQTGTAM